MITIIDCPLELDKEFLYKPDFFGGRMRVCVKIGHSSWGQSWYMIMMILHVKNCYTSGNLCSKLSKMWSILLRNTGEFAPRQYCTSDDLIFNILCLY